MFFQCAPEVAYLITRFSQMTGIHPTIISESFQKALEKGIEILTDMSRPVELSDRETLLNSAATSLNSKVR